MTSSSGTNSNAVPMNPVELRSTPTNPTAHSSTWTMADQANEGTYDSLDLSFDDLGEEGNLQNHENTSLEQRVHDDSGKEMLKQKAQDLDVCDSNEYILGTLIVRVVAARDLQSVSSQGLGGFFFGGHHASGGGKKQGSANPYASVRFGKTTQRTSEVYGTVDPTWPRGEAMYMDVMHPPLQESADQEVNPGVASRPPHPGDPPKKQESVSLKKVYPSKPSPNNMTDLDSQRTLPKPILVVAIFHASDVGGKVHKYPSKGMSGDSDDLFLGMASIDLTELLTGKIRVFDEWLPLSGTTAPRASVRVVCEYEASDGAPSPGDLVRFTQFCHPADLFPLYPEKLYKVEETDGDYLLISWTSQEGWTSTFQVHRFMVICEERHHGPIDFYQNELVSITERVSHSPMALALRESVQRIPDEGLLHIGSNIVRGGYSLWSRWTQGGLETAVGDVVYATNWDGRFNPTAEERLATPSGEEEPPLVEETQNPTTQNTFDDILDESKLSIEPIPNMPACPITGEPMRDPVVAADGHTYERSAIARWLRESDRSPLTGSVLPHKNLVPNYMLMSSLSENLIGAPKEPPKLKDPPVPRECKGEEHDDNDTVDVSIED